MNYKKLLQEILELLETDSSSELIDHRISTKSPFTQEKAEEMSQLLGIVYLKVHKIYCPGCASDSKE